MCILRKAIKNGISHQGQLTSGATTYSEEINYVTYKDLNTRSCEIPRRAFRLLKNPTIILK